MSYYQYICFNKSLNILITFVIARLLYFGHFAIFIYFNYNCKRPAKVKAIIKIDKVETEPLFVELGSLVTKFIIVNTL